MAGARFTDRYHDVLTAVGTLVIAWLTATLWWTTRGQLRHLEEALRLAHLDRISVHRPHLKVRSFKRSRFIEGEPMNVQYEIVNVGGTIATIVRSEATLYIGAPRTLWPNGTFHTASEMGIGRQLLPGGRLLIQPQAFKITYKNEWNLNVSVTIEGGSLELRGFVDYQDGAGAIRRTAFMRLSDGYSFIYPNEIDPDHEYED